VTRNNRGATNRTTTVKIRTRGHFRFQRIRAASGAFNASRRLFDERAARDGRVTTKKIVEKAKRTTIFASKSIDPDGVRVTTDRCCTIRRVSNLPNRIRSR